MQFLEWAAAPFNAPRDARATPGGFETRLPFVHFDRYERAVAAVAGVEGGRKRVTKGFAGLDRAAEAVMAAEAARASRSRAASDVSESGVRTAWLRSGVDARQVHRLRYPATDFGCAGFNGSVYLVGDKHAEAVEGLELSIVAAGDAVGCEEPGCEQSASQERVTPRSPRAHTGGEGGSAPAIRALRTSLAGRSKEVQLTAARQGEKTALPELQDSHSVLLQPVVAGAAGSLPAAVEVWVSRPAAERLRHCAFSPDSIFPTPVTPPPSRRMALCLPLSRSG
jgi:hypothetical protein